MEFSNMSSTVFIALVKSFNPKDWTIRFWQKGTLDNMSEYPKAYPIFDHTNEIYENDEVYVIKSCVDNNNQYYYLPVTIMEFVGLHNKESFIDITNRGLLDYESIHVMGWARDYSKLVTVNKSTDTSDTKEFNTNKFVINIPTADTDKGDVTRRKPVFPQGKSEGELDINVAGVATKDITKSSTTNIGTTYVLNVGSSITITTGTSTITCTTTHNGDITINGNVTVNGNITATGNISAGGDVNSSGVASLNSHIHGNGNMGTPTTAPLG